MTEPTIEDAKALIERTKACRQSCDDCSEFTYDVRGVGAPLADNFHEELGKLISSFLSKDWEHQAHSRSFLRRCAACRQRPEFPWADKLEAEKVLAFMVANADRGAFWLGDLRKTLMPEPTEAA
jgi:hypothetical protein